MKDRLMKITNYSIVYRRNVSGGKHELSFNVHVIHFWKQACRNTVDATQKGGQLQDHREAIWLHSLND